MSWLWRTGCSGLGLEILEPNALPTTKNLVLDLCLLVMPIAFDLPLRRCRNGVLRAQSTKRKEHQAVVTSRGGVSYHLSFLVTKPEGRWEDGTELAVFDPSFISRLSAVGLGGSDSNFEHTIKVYTPHTNSRQIRGLLYLTFLQNESVHHFQP